MFDMIGKGKSVIILPWIATSTNEVDFHADPAFTFPTQSQVSI